MRQTRPKRSKKGVDDKVFQVAKETKELERIKVIIRRFQSKKP